MSHHTNITRIKAVSNALGPLKSEVVFVGGATVSLYADRRAIEVRPTEDVDIVVEIATKHEYAQLEERLRTMGFQNDITARFVGRYLLPGIIVDVIPTDESISGFSNRWYEGGKFLLEEFKTLHDNKHAEEWIAAHAGYGSPPSTYIILDEIQKIIE
ncbi:hypothetical protein D3H65_32370 [Paraflavitalea soli]|uniref:Nucleotidyl transferase AbiEii/AbiGii toxin family protein n=1 Tax=Paraflavitalea soli TaxID=2315862 RepID=A0A3B7N9B3_9BACT|nr:hypothetical protein [Paraflavitalea soli]AXY78401.1 hypothetical protein D3H65_32370 [Paraflavitalea soli]